MAYKVKMNLTYYGPDGETRRALLKHGQSVRLTTEEVEFAKSVFDFEWDATATN